LSKNSLEYSFLNTEGKQVITDKFDQNITSFEQSFKKNGVDSLTKSPVLNEFIRRQYPQLIQSIN